MKLSEAIREGAKKRPMVKNDFFVYENYECLGSCALGAAYEALTGAPIPQGQLASEKWVFDTIKAYTEIDLHQIAEDPASGPLSENGQLWVIISMLNDSGNWTREQIADWLEGQAL